MSFTITTWNHLPIATVESEAAAIETARREARERGQIVRATETPAPVGKRATFECSAHDQRGRWVDLNEPTPADDWFDGSADEQGA